MLDNKRRSGRRVCVYILNHSAQDMFEFLAVLQPRVAVTFVYQQLLVGQTIQKRQQFSFFFLCEADGLDEFAFVWVIGADAGVWARRNGTAAC